MEKCDVKTEAGMCGQQATNWCYKTIGDKDHNHNVCDAHWDTKQKACRQPGATGQAPPSRATPNKGGGRGDNSPPVRKI
jgi:hypothetical protein